MDESHADNENQAQPPVSQSANQAVPSEENSKPVAWTPEDASRFLTSAIHEAQKPLADALRHRPVTTPIFVLIVLALLGAGGGVAWLLHQRLEQREGELASVRADRESVVTEKVELQGKAEVLEQRLSAVRQEQERLNAEFIKAHEMLRGQDQSRRDYDEQMRKIQAEMVRFRRQNELLRTQISGLEMEKEALAKQLEAVKALVVDFSGEEISLSADDSYNDTLQPFPVSVVLASPEQTNLAGSIGVEDGQTLVVVNPEFLTLAEEPEPEIFAPEDATGGEDSISGPDPTNAVASTAPPEQIEQPAPTRESDANTYEPEESAAPLGVMDSEEPAGATAVSGHDADEPAASITETVADDENTADGDAVSGAETASDDPPTLLEMGLESPEQTSSAVETESGIGSGQTVPGVPAEPENDASEPPVQPSSPPAPAQTSQTTDNYI